jgi:L-alanine-DL-glutamate epimerase-like enolase superfamily enzyme
MTRIENVTIHRRTMPLTRPFVTAVRRTHAVDALIVEVRDSDGRSGWGEAPTSWRVTGESHASVRAAIEGPLTEAVTGFPVDDPAGASDAMARAVVGNASARMAVDCAVYDLAARAAELPLFRFLGGTSGTVITDMTLSAAANAEEATELVRQAVEHAENGFTTLKVKTGAGGDDLRLLTDVRHALGDGVRLRVDANQGWSAKAATEIVRAWEDAGIGIELVEQPVHRDDIAGLAYVTAHTSTPIVADEAVWRRRHLIELLNRKAVSRINIKLAKTGGLREALALAQLAEDNGVDVFVGCMSESHVGIASAAALASALGARGSLVGAQDLDGGAWLAESPVAGGVEYSGETIALPDMPGTGITGVRG